MHLFILSSSFIQQIPKKNTIHICNNGDKIIIVLPFSKVNQGVNLFIKLNQKYRQTPTTEFILVPKLKCLFLQIIETVDLTNIFCTLKMDGLKFEVATI